MFNKDLTKLKWKKNIYYVSDNIIFDITSKKKKSDLDECGTYLIDFEKTSEKARKAVDGTTLDITDTPDAFVNNVPYISLKFLGGHGEELLKTYPLQYLIEKGDKFLDGKTEQQHPDIFDNSYVNKFNQEVFDYIKSILKGKADFDSKNLSKVMKLLPDWLTTGNEFNYMTVDFIEKYFLKGFHYNETLAKKNAKKGDTLYFFNQAVIGIGDNFVPVNIWQEEVVDYLIKAIYAENTVNKYNASVKNEFNALSVDTMEKIADSIKNSEMSFNKKGLKTFLNTHYRDHDCEGVSVESVCANEDIDTWYEYLKKKEDAPELILEDTIADAKNIVEQYIQNNFDDQEEVHKYWWETDVTMDKYYTVEGAEENKIESILNVFTVAQNDKRVVLMIYHEGDSKVVNEHKNALWVGDNDLYKRTEEIVLDFKTAYQNMINSDYAKPESRQCSFRAQLGPNGANTPPQFIFGNLHTQLYVNAKTGEVLNYSPVFNPSDETDNND